MKTFTNRAFYGIQFVKNIEFLKLTICFSSNNEIIYFYKSLLKFFKMTRLCFFLTLTLFLLSNTSIEAQRKKYTTSDGEFIFSWGNLAYTNEYLQENPEAEIVDNPLRFTCFFHLGQNYHYDLSKNFGIIAGYGLRNVGLITDEVLPQEIGSDSYFNAKIVRRSYSVGIPLAIKVGSMENRFFVFAGGELEWAFAYKEKYWSSHSRSGVKSKYSDFMGKQVKPLLPSIFCGVKLPKGMNIKLKYYMTDFLNHNYSKNSSGKNQVVSDLTKYKKSQLVYFGLTWQFEPKEIIKKQKQTEVASIW